MELLFAHLVGDYLLQSDWMSQNKRKSLFAVSAHAFTYTLPFLFVTQSIIALSIICLTHLVIDHFGLARYLCYAKNFLAPKEYWYSWKDCKGTGYHKDKDAYLTVWLMIIADNTLHLIINHWAVKTFG